MAEIKKILEQEFATLEQANAARNYLNSIYDSWSPVSIPPRELIKYEGDKAELKSIIVIGHEEFNARIIEPPANISIEDIKSKLEEIAGQE